MERTEQELALWTIWAQRPIIEFMRQAGHRTGAMALLSKIRDERMTEALLNDTYVGAQMSLCIRIFSEELLEMARRLRNALGAPWSAEVGDRGKIVTLKDGKYLESLSYAVAEELLGLLKPSKKPRTDKAVQAALAKARKKVGEVGEGSEE